MGRSEKTSSGAPDCRPQALRGGCAELGSASAPVNSDGAGGDGLELCQGGSGWMLGEISNQKE